MNIPNSLDLGGNSTAAANQHIPEGDPGLIQLGEKAGVLLLDHSDLDILLQSPLPGIVIFVHGVNSDGEWYQAAEEGLCAGLNKRLKRCDEHMAYPTVDGGQLTPASYMTELTEDGFINPEMRPDNYMDNEDHFTPVIRFRWGYKANAEELQHYGDAIYLNEQDYWGGGPFANGCSSLPDLWSEGLSDSMFLWMNVEHLNPDPSRNIFSCPHRAYFVLAALRLARLVETIRTKQADVPITIVCHSQGNMIGMAAAFIGDQRGMVSDPRGVAGRCVADNYVLTNPPYSLVKSNLTEDWGDSHMTDRNGGRGRQTEEARIATLRAFFDIIRQPASVHQDAQSLDEFMANEQHGFNIAKDRAQYGYGMKPSTCCRVTLYCNPHDQVISATPVQGIGWRGMSAQEIDASGGSGVFCQRVFAQGFPVGVKGTYDYWADHWKGLGDKRGSESFWSPPSLAAKYSLSRGAASNSSFLGKVLTCMFAPIMIIATKLANISINALPDKHWAIPLDAPDLEYPFKPEAMRFKNTSAKFDQGHDAPGQHRNRSRIRAPDDPYAGDRPLPPTDQEAETETSDAAKGDLASEAALRCDDHARLRMLAKREGWVAKSDHVTEEDHPEQASAEYKAWRSRKIQANLADCVTSNATDHSTILTNPMHSEKALAYDVAIGMCNIRTSDLHKLRMAADWRFCEGLSMGTSHEIFSEYFVSGYLQRQLLSEWIRAENSEGKMPCKVIDQREHQPHKHSQQSGGHP